jgi:hypothetical protein
MVDFKSKLKEHKLDQAICGIVSGGTSTIILHPLDLVKTQFQGFQFNFKYTDLI